MKNIEFISSGIKCDNENCNFKDESVEFNQYNDWINKPCPLCGSNLLTERDYQNVLHLLKFVEIANQSEKNESFKGDTTKLNVKMDGTGKMTISKE